MSGGLIFLLSLAAAFVTGGGIPVFFIAMLMLNIGNSIAKEVFKEVGGEIRGEIGREINREVRQRGRGGRQQWSIEEAWDRRRSRDQRSSRDDRYTLSDSRRRELPSRAASTSTQAKTKAKSVDHPHADEAVRRAGIDPDRAGLTLTDVGLIVYGPEPRPVVHRELAVPDTADYVQPFAELKAVRAARGVLTFELVDPAGEVVYRREEQQQIKAGKTAVIARTRLPMGDHFDFSQGWTLRLYANDVLLAEHPFGWFDPSNRTEALREVMSNDGELTADLSALMEDEGFQPMSLDDLLGEEEAAPRRRAAR